MDAIKISKEKETLALRESKWQVAREDLREERKFWESYHPTSKTEKNQQNAKQK